MVLGGKKPGGNGLGLFFLFFFFLVLLTFPFSSLFRFPFRVCQGQ